VQYDSTDPPLTPNPIPGMEEEDNWIGILVGICIAFFFLLILIIICVLKEPCKKNKYVNASTMKEYLYQKRLLEVRAADARSNGTTSEESDESKIQKNKSKNGLSH